MANRQKQHIVRHDIEVEHQARPFFVAGAEELEARQSYGFPASHSRPELTFFRCRVQCCDGPAG
ncbi:MAG: hypothetical protein ACREDA_00920, partial [Methylocella sp.]